MKLALISNQPIAFTYKDCEIRCFDSEEAVTPKDWLAYDAAFLLPPVSETAIKRWTGHPHLRFAENTETLKEEVAFLFSHIECEKKFLIQMPDFERLDKYHPFCCDIEQVYLLDTAGTHRIRKRKMRNALSFVETFKSNGSGLARTEIEAPITEGEYAEKRKEADPAKHPIHKKRYCFLCNGKYFELDVYPFWTDYAVLELELKSEEEAYSLPPEVTVVSDVTDDYRYKNAYLAGVRDEDYQAYFL